MDTRGGFAYTDSMKITIDGPAGVGKSTAARQLAARLSVRYLDTGATYRAVTLRALRAGDDLADTDVMVRHATEMKLELIDGEASLRVMLDGEDVSQAIRDDAVSRQAHYAANSPPVREVLVLRQREMGEALGSFVAEGRDQGTVVFPDADVKLFLTADPAERARRRVAELLARGQEAEFDDVLSSIQTRDDSDRNRAVGPLRQPDDAIVVDTTHLTIEGVIDELVRRVKENTP
jgi:cytidylate kinase